MNDKVKEILMKAVVSGTSGEVESACKRYPLVFDEEYFDYKLLEAALLRQHQTIILSLLNKYGCRPKNSNEVSSEKTLLYLAARMKNDYVIRSILRKGASMYDKNHDGETTLETLFKEESEAVCKLLTFSKPKCEPENEDVILHFQIACFMNHTSAVKEYLKCGIDPNKPLALDSTEYFGLTPLQLAAEKNYYDIFKLLVLHGGDLSTKNASGSTPLHILYYSSHSTERISRIEETFKNGNDTKFINAVDSNNLSHFHLACTLDESNYAQRFIANGANVNGSVSWRCTIDPLFTPLHFAAENGCARVVELLLKNGADCNKKNQTGETPLHLACKISGYWKIQIIKMLLHYKASPTILDKERNTPLHVEFYHVNSENKEIFEALSSKISRKNNFMNKEGLSLFHIACATNDIKRINTFLNTGVKVDSCVSSGIFSGYTALHFAVLHNQKDVVELLLKKNAQVNIKTTSLEITPLHLACEFNYMKFRQENAKFQEKGYNPFPVDLNSTNNRAKQFEIIELLLLHGAHVDATDFDGITPLLHTSRIDYNYSSLLSWSYQQCNRLETEAFMKEISFRMKEIIEILFSNKANVTARTSKQETILHFIAKYKTLRITEKLIKLILSEGADINAIDESRLTPLHVAVQCNNKRLIRILLKYNANINAICKNFNTPLFTVIKNGLKNCHEKEIFSSLLDNGCDVNTRCRDKALLDYVSGCSEYIFIIEKLLEYGADINVEHSLVNLCVTCTMMKWKQEGSIYAWYGKGKFVRLFEIIFTHVQKLSALELHISKKVNHFVSALNICYQEIKSNYSDSTDSTDNSSIDDVFNDCIQELEKMKLIKIDNYTSLYSILIKDSHSLSKHMRNSRFIEIATLTDTITKFPLYSYLVKLQFKRGSIRSELLDSVKASLPRIINLDLPDLVFDFIMKYLTNEDLANLNAAASLKKDLKRKLDDDKKKVEPTVKMLKVKKSNTK